MSDVSIYRPAKTAMQSGRARCNLWVLEFSATLAQRRDSLMGWAGRGDTRGQIRLEFPTGEDAVAFAEHHGLSFEIHSGRERKILPKAYADNFSYTRTMSWTH